MRARKDGEILDCKKETVLKSGGNRRTQDLTKSVHL